MARVNERIALGIGVQTLRGTPLAAVLNATGLITAAATGTDATGILLRDPGDLSKAFTRVESEGGTIPGSLSRLSGTFQRHEIAVSFTIDARGNGVATTTPIAGEFTFDEYFERILAGARLTRGAESSSDTLYEFASTQEFQTLKIWRGDDESWTLVGCTFNLTWNLTAGEKATITVDVIADSVVYNDADTFPPTAATVAYGTQLDASPILEQALVTLDSDIRGFQTASLSVSYGEVDFQDANVITGIVKEQDTRTVELSADFILDSVQAKRDFEQLANNLDSGASPVLPVLFTLGQAAGAGEIQNAMKFDIPNWRITDTDKVDATKVVRTLTGFAVIAGSSGDGSLLNEEFVLSGV